MGLATGVQVPTVRKIVAMRTGTEGTPSTEMQALGKKAATVGGIVNLLWVAILFLMVFKPGH